MAEDAIQEASNQQSHHQADPAAKPVAPPRRPHGAVAGVHVHQQTNVIGSVRSAGESLRVMGLATVADGGVVGDRLLVACSFATPIHTPKPRLNLLKGARVSTLLRCQQK